MPFPKLAEKLNADEGSSEADPVLLERVRFAVGAAASGVPWRSDCYPQAIAAHKLLVSAGHASTVHLGVDKAGEGDLLAHAWLTCGDTVVVGGAERDRYSEMTTF